MDYMTNTCAAMLCSALLCLFTFDASAADPPTFKSQIFKTGMLVYPDDFDGKINRGRWGAPTKDKQFADGKLIVSAKFKSNEEAMKVLKRDHHEKVLQIPLEKGKWIGGLLQTFPLAYQAR